MPERIRLPYEDLPPPADATMPLQKEYQCVWGIVYKNSEHFIFKRERTWLFCLLTKSLLFVFGLPFILFAIVGLSYKLTLSSLRTRGINHTFIGHSWLGGSLPSFCPCLRAMSVNIYCEVRGCQKHLCFSHFCCQVVPVDTKCVWGLDTFGPLSALFIWGKK